MTQRIYINILKMFIIAYYIVLILELISFILYLITIMPLRYDILIVLLSNGVVIYIIRMLNCWWIKMTPKYSLIIWYYNHYFPIITLVYGISSTNIVIMTTNYCYNSWLFLSSFVAITNGPSRVKLTNNPTSKSYQQSHSPIPSNEASCHHSLPFSLKLIPSNGIF